MEASPQGATPGGNSSPFKSPTRAKISEKFKIVFLGDQGVGKTSVINRYMNDAFTDSYIVFLHVNMSRQQ